MSLASTVAKQSRPTNVTRTTAVVFGPDGRPNGSQTSTTTSVRICCQPANSDSQSRQLDGDEAQGRILVHVTNAALAAVGWTDLQTSPAPDSDGPPADRIEYKGRIYELVERSRWEDEGFSGPCRFQSYIGSLRGAV